MSNLNPTLYFQSPLEVVKVTSENIQEAADWCGGTIEQVESRHVPGRMDSYIQVPTPKANKINKGSWAFPGMFITKRLVVTEKDTLKATFSVFRKDYLTKNCFVQPEEAFEATHGRAAREAFERETNPTAVAQAMQKAFQAIKKPSMGVLSGSIANVEGDLVETKGGVRPAGSYVDEARGLTLIEVNVTDPRVEPQELFSKIRRVMDDRA